LFDRPAGFGVKKFSRTADKQDRHGDVGELTGLIFLNDNDDVALRVVFPADDDILMDLDKLRGARRRRQDGDLNDPWLDEELAADDDRVDRLKPEAAAFLAALAFTGFEFDRVQWHRGFEFLDPGRARALAVSLAGSHVG
jgi:hypothetical protein